MRFLHLTPRQATPYLLGETTTSKVQRRMPLAFSTLPLHPKADAAVLRMSGATPHRFLSRFYERADWKLAFSSFPKLISFLLETT